MLQALFSLMTYYTSFSFMHPQAQPNGLVSTKATALAQSLRAQLSPPLLTPATQGGPSGSLRRALLLSEAGPLDPSDFARGDDIRDNGGKGEI